MHFSTKTLISALTLLQSASAMVTGFRAPDAIVASQPFEVSLLQNSSVYSETDVAVVFGISPNDLPDGFIGNILGSNYLGLEMDFSLSSWDYNLKTDMYGYEVEQGNYTLFAAVYSVDLESGGVVGIRKWMVTVAVADRVGNGTVESTDAMMV